MATAGTRAPRAVRRTGGEPDRRTALLDAAEALLAEEGYSALTSRRVGERAGSNAALIHYYFGSMDGLYVELFRRGAQRGLDALVATLHSPQPMWALWDALRDNLNAIRTVEFFALAHHNNAVETEVREFSARYRQAQLDVLGEVLEGYGLDIETWPPVAIILVMGSTSLLMHIEKSIGFEAGHAELVAIAERQIRELEGDRWTAHPALARRAR